MLYKFKSRATADLIMLEAQGRRILEIVGKPPGDAHGIITAEQIPAAIAALQAAVAADEAAGAPGAADGADAAQVDEAAVPPHAAVRLRQRAAPFIDMLRRSADEGYEVIW